MSDASPPELCAVVVTWNSAETIADCLETLEKSLAGIDSQIIVVDNDSSDSTVLLAEARPESVTVVANSSNRGLAAANNQGIKASTSEWILISNPDVVYEPATVTEMLACGRRHERAAFVIPRLRNADGTTQTSAGDLPTLISAVLGRSFASARNATTGFWWDGWAHDSERLIGRGSECCYLVRRSAVADVGAQDEKFVLDWEGIDWTERMRAAGWEVWFTPTAVATHIGAVSTRQVRTRWIVSTHRGMYRYFAIRSSWWFRPIIAAIVWSRAAVKLTVNQLRRLLGNS